MEFALIFDWDGVIIDSSIAHEESWERLSHEINKPLPEGHFKKGFGMKNEWIIPNILEWENDEYIVNKLSLRKEKLYREVVNDKGVETIPGLHVFLEELQSNNIPFAIGSSTHRENIICALEYLKLVESFPIIVSAEDVSLGKPNPDVFLKAASKLKSPPEKCVVYEDTPVGLEAAKKGGMKVVGLLTSHRSEKMGDADILIDDLSGLSVEELKSLVN